MSHITVSAIQTSFSTDTTKNISKVSDYVLTAAKEKANVVLIPELFENIYFCKEEKEDYFSLARPTKDHPTITHFQKMAKELKLVIPVSFFEHDGQCYYNSIAMVDADGSLMGVYRKSHIPDGPGYEEKFYFRPGNTGFKTWCTLYGKIGVGICWDQWFPECARGMMLQGAEILLYPTAIGTEPENPDLDTKDLWQKAMIGHSVSNVVPVIAANRIGLEGTQQFYGHSFISDHRGQIKRELRSQEEGVITETFDLEAINKNRASFGFFRDLRPEFYTGALGI
jgi:N-carbamoylputrescine amidase